LQTLNSTVSPLRYAEEAWLFRYLPECDRLIQELPSINRLTKTLIDAQANMRRKTWQPLAPEQISQLFSSQLDND